MEKVREASAGILAVFTGANGLFDIGLLNQYLAAIVSLCLITFYVKKIFTTKKEN